MESRSIAGTRGHEDSFDVGMRYIEANDVPKSTANYDGVAPRFRMHHASHEDQYGGSPGHRS